MQDALNAMPLAAGDWIGFLAVFLIFGGGGVLVKIFDSLTRSRVEIAQLRQQNTGGENLKRDVVALQEEVRILREQLRELRDTTTQYDLSFDTSLQRLENRIRHIEQPADIQRNIGS